MPAMIDLNDIPISLYVHIPWCVRKCPYCDFNSHPLRDEIPEQDYVSRLVDDFRSKLEMIQARSLHSLFIGGGTPSLFSPSGYETLFNALRRDWGLSSDLEITLEANPGTVLEQYLQGYREIGINRLSIGAQSFQADKLKRLGRIHNPNDIHQAFGAAKKAGFEDINLDLMFGLPHQSPDEAMDDLHQAIQLSPTHLSWYQLTLEPNTLFYKQPPPLPHQEEIWDMQQQGQQLLAHHDFQQYEVSAYSKKNRECQHNLNYWEFGDYLGIGAGAHGKITDGKTKQITRHANFKHPKIYLNPQKNFVEKFTTIPDKEIAFEFMLNHLRLQKPISIDFFEKRTGMNIKNIESELSTAVQENFLKINQYQIETTEFGKRFLNNLLEIFL